MASRPSAKTAVAKPGDVVTSPKAIDPATAAMTAKALYEAGKAGVDLSASLYGAIKGAVALVGAVHESLTVNDRFRLRLRLSNLCPHGIAINTFKLASMKEVAVAVYLMRPAAWRWEDSPESSALTPSVPGKTGVRTSSAFVIPPMGTQEIVVEVDRAAVLARIHNKRGATLTVSYNVLGDDGDEKDLKIEILFRDDQPILAGYPIPGV